MIKQNDLILFENKIYIVDVFLAENIIKCSSYPENNIIGTSIITDIKNVQLFSTPTHKFKLGDIIQNDAKTYEIKKLNTEMYLVDSGKNYLESFKFKDYLEHNFNTISNIYLDNIPEINDNNSCGYHNPLCEIVESCTGICSKGDTFLYCRIHKKEV